MKLLIGWLINAAALYVTTKIVPGISVESWQILFLAAAVIGVVNALIKPIAQLIALPLTILTIGLFALVVNAIMLALAAWLVSGFDIDGFWPALFGALVLSLVSTILHTLLNPKPH